MSAIGGTYGRLWSLWEMMEIKAKAFALACDYIGQLSAAEKKSFQPTSSAEIEFSEPQTIFSIPFDDFREQLQILGLTTSIVSLDRVRAVLSESVINSKVMKQRIDELRLRMLDELNNTKFLYLNPLAQSYFEPVQPIFGQEVYSKFPTVAYDIDEAAKCFALERSTAAAFHLIRSLEAALRGMSRCLGIPDPTRGSDRSWFKVLASIKGQIDIRWPNSSDRMAGDGRFFEETYAVLAAMMNPYRNSTMHLDQKYTLDEALHLFGMVKGFMMKVASRMDEEGEPKV